MPLSFRCIIPFCLFLSQHCFAQEWQLSEIDRSQKYPYHYIVRPGDNKDSARFKLTIKEGKGQSEIRIIDEEGHAIWFSTLSLPKAENDSTYKLQTDEKGYWNGPLPKGSYDMRIEAQQYYPFHIQFALKEGQAFKLLVHLTQNLELSVYEVNAKYKLLTKEKKEILNCIRQHPSNFDQCAKPKKYIILQQI